MQIRHATLADVETLGEINFKSWRTTYEGLIEGGMPVKLTPEEMYAKWERTLSRIEDNSDRFVLIAEVEGQTVGYSVCGKNRKEELSEYDWELYAIYLLKEFQGKGVGKALFKESVKEMNHRGANSFILFVLTTNTPSVVFYESFKPDFKHDSIIILEGNEYPHTGYGWHNTSDFPCN